MWRVSVVASCSPEVCPRWAHSSSPCALFLLLERLLYRLLDVLVVLVEDFVFLLGEDAKGDAHHALGELHVQPVLAARDAAGDVEIEMPHAAALVVELELVP